MSLFISLSLSYPLVYLLLAKHDVISFIDVQSKLPSLVNSIAHKLQIPLSLVVSFMSKDTAVEIAKVLVVGRAEVGQSYCHQEEILPSLRDKLLPLRRSVVPRKCSSP